MNQSKKFSDLNLSKCCLGTMSFGAHVDESESDRIMDRSLELGVDFFDTAELYAVPPTADTWGETERIIGRWMKKRGKRDEVFLATKVASNPGGNRGGLGWIRDRGGDLWLDAEQITEALEGSLERLQTDSIDLYQLHWPQRPTNFFGRRAYPYAEMPQKQKVEDDMREALETLGKLIQAGKIRHWGLSNETPWGTMTWIHLADEMGIPRPVSIQNNYSLLTRTYDTAMAEVSHREEIPLLAYSPLGFGVLGGRYLNGGQPKGGRFTVYPEFNTRYRTPQVEAITQQYADLAQQYDMSLAQMSLAFAYSRPFMGSVIIGPSTVEQLEENVGALNIQLSQEILEGIEAIHALCPDPAPQ